jgi:hypothetical protein
MKKWNHQPPNLISCLHLDMENGLEVVGVLNQLKDHLFRST